MYFRYIQPPDHIIIHHCDVTVTLASGRLVVRPDWSPVLVTGEKP